MALRWSDIDLDFATLSVSGSLHKVKGARATIFEEPKNQASRRLVDLDPTTIAMLRRHQEYQQAQFNTLIGPGRRTPRCIAGLMELLVPTTVTHAFIRMARRAGLDGVRLLLNTSFRIET
jgi:integrase